MIAIIRVTAMNSPFTSGPLAIPNARSSGNKILGFIIAPHHVFYRTAWILLSVDSFIAPSCNYVGFSYEKKIFTFSTYTKIGNKEDYSEKYKKNRRSALRSNICFIVGLEKNILTCLLISYWSGELQNLQAPHKQIWNWNNWIIGVYCWEYFKAKTRYFLLNTLICILGWILASC